MTTTLEEVRVAESACRPVYDKANARRSAALLLFILCSLGAVVAYLLVIAHDGVNVVYWDDWGFAPIIRSTLEGHLSFGQLWAPHAEERFLFPNLVAIPLVLITSWNAFAFYGFSAACLIGTFTLIVRAFWHPIREYPLRWLPMPFVLFTFAQVENTLWAVQISWYMGEAACVGSFYLLTRRSLSRVGLVSAAALGVVASYSVSQALLVWPIGLILLSIPGRPRWARISWVAIGGLTVIGYSRGMSAGQAGIYPLGTYMHHVTTTALAFLVAVGSVIPNVSVILGNYGSQTVAEYLGAAILIGAVAVIVRWLRSQRPSGPRAFAMALVALGVGFDVMLIPARLYDNITGATASRYVTFNVLILIGIYATCAMTSPPREPSRSVALNARGAMLLILIAQVVVATRVGLWEGNWSHSYRLTSADILANISKAPDYLVGPYVLPATATYARNFAPFLEQHHMSVFADQQQPFRQLGIVLGGTQPPQLAPPLQIESQIRSDHGAKVAWTALSAVFQASDGALEPYVLGPGGTANLVKWAAGLPPIPASELSVWNPPPIGAFLQPYASYYKSWSRQLAAKS